MGDESSMINPRLEFTLSMREAKWSLCK